MCKLATITVDNRIIKVAENKKDYVQNIIDAAQKCDYIDRVILFGSSMTSKCTDESDIDIAVFGNVSRSRCLTSKKYKYFTHQIYGYNDFSQTYDVLYFRSGEKDDTLLMDEIKRGALLYERK